jgi:hypothetical protein
LDLTFFHRFFIPTIATPAWQGFQVPSSDGNGAATRDDTALPLTSSLKKADTKYSKYLKSTYLND